MVNALIFDCDGVLADTERFGHLPAFNQTFKEFGLPVQWSEEEYGEKLKIGGGKERMASLFTDDFVRQAHLPSDKEGQQKVLAEWHKRKTAIFKDRRIPHPRQASRRSGRSRRSYILIATE